MRFLLSASQGLLGTLVDSLPWPARTHGCCDSRGRDFRLRLCLFHFLIWWASIIWVNRLKMSQPVPKTYREGFPAKDKGGEKEEQRMPWCPSQAFGASWLLFTGQQTILSGMFVLVKSSRSDSCAGKSWIPLDEAGVVGGCSSCSDLSEEHSAKLSLSWIRGGKWKETHINPIYSWPSVSGKPFGTSQKKSVIMSQSNGSLGFYSGGVNGQIMAHVTGSPL